MAALLVAMSVMAILMSVALPTWTRMIQREKEEELIFRGEQYARALREYSRNKGGVAAPNNLDELIEARYLRKKFKDPLSPEKDGEFQLLRVATSSAGSQQPSSGQAGTAGSLLSTSGSGSIMGVASKNTAQSIRTYKGKNHYNEWQFIGTQQSTQAGTGAQGSQRGGPQGGGPPGSGSGSGTGPLRGGQQQNRSGFPPPGGQQPPPNSNLPPRMQQP